MPEVVPNQIRTMDLWKISSKYVCTVGFWTFFQTIFEVPQSTCLIRAMIERHKVWYLRKASFSYLIRKEYQDIGRKAVAKGIVWVTVLGELAASRLP